MKSKITMVAVLLGLKITAQTITYANFSTSLTQTLNVAIASQSSFNLALTTTTGNAVTWNAGGLVQQTGTPLIHFIYGNPASTPNGALFPTSNYAQYDPALTSVIAYGYVNFSADSVVTVGEYSPSTAHEIYQNGDKHLIFPFAYGQTFNDNYAKTNYSNATTISSFQTGSRTVTYNGYGTLILPQGTFNNVALISEMRTNSIGPNSNSYTWYQVSNGKKLMFYENNAGNITIAYNTDLASGINELNSKYSIILFPNPASESVQLNINSPKQLINNELKLIDAYGKEVRSINFNENFVVIKRNELKSGVYFYSLKTEDNTVLTGKIVFE